MAFCFQVRIVSLTQNSPPGTLSAVCACDTSSCATTSSAERAPRHFSLSFFIAQSLSRAPAGAQNRSISVYIESSHTCFSHTSCRRGPCLAQAGTAERCGSRRRCANLSLKHISPKSSSSHTSQSAVPAAVYEAAFVACVTAHSLASGAGLVFDGGE